MTVAEQAEQQAEGKNEEQSIVDQFPNLEALLDVELPLISILAEKQMILSDILKLDIGSVIVFPKHNSDPIPLLVNNQQVGAGKTIKVGDHFGLHLRTYSQEAAAQAVS